MIRIECYKTSDGRIFESERAASDHEENRLGEELDGLLKLFAFPGCVTRVDEYKAILQLMKRKDELRAACSEIVRIIDHSQQNEDEG